MNSNFPLGTAKCKSCLQTISLLNKEKGVGVQYCCCGVFFCSTNCFNKEAAEHQHASELAFERMITVFRCSTCQKGVDVCQKPPEDFLYCECSSVFCSAACWKKVEDKHLKHISQASGFPCSFRRYLTNEGRILYLEDINHDCSQCDRTGQKLDCFCELCQGYYCSEGCLKKHPCLNDEVDENEEDE